jgi:hypothetical protein
MITASLSPFFGRFFIFSGLWRLAEKTLKFGLTFPKAQDEITYFSTRNIDGKRNRTQYKILYSETFLEPD